MYFYAMALKAKQKMDFNANHLIFGVYHHAIVNLLVVR